MYFFFLLTNPHPEQEYAENNTIQKTGAPSLSFSRNFESSLLWVSCFLSHTQTQTTGLLQHPNIPSRERKKEERRRWRGTFKKYHSNKIFLLLWDPPLLIQHREKWSGKGLLLVPIQKGERQKRERETYFLWGKTENRMNDATVDGELLSATTKMNYRRL